ncbi:MAG: DUF1501 domain-containing protein [Parvibaculaceae bacterium]
MPSLSRRKLLKFGLAGAGTLFFPQASFAQAHANPADPHFFLFIVLNGGADHSYMFDARPLALTAAGRIQNYTGKEPSKWTGVNDGHTLISPLMRPLRRYMDGFSVVNGVHMAPSFDGHQQNLNFLFTGDPFGGGSFIPHLNLADTGSEPKTLDAILPTPPVVTNLDNHSGVIPLQAESVGDLAAFLKNTDAPSAKSPLGEFMRSRMLAQKRDGGRMASAANLVLASYDRAARVRSQLSGLSVEASRGSEEEKAASLIAECFHLSVSRSAIYVLPEQFDVHAANLARGQPGLFSTAVERIAILFRALDNAPFDAHSSVLDVTTVMIASEFGRTMRAPYMPIDDTGTNHNQHCNSIIIGGKGVRGGMIIGASDLQSADEEVSKAHLAVDPALEKTLGLPFDFARMRPRRDKPESFEISDYLTIGSVVNTVYSAFNVPSRFYRRVASDGPAAPVLRALLS